MKRIPIILLTLALYMGARAEVITTDEAVRLLDATEIMEGGGLGYNSPDAYNKLKPWIQGHSLEIIREFLGDPAKAKQLPNLVILVAGNSTDDEFLQVSLEALRGFSEGKVDEKTLSAVLMPHEDKSGLLDVNFRDQRVASALKACLSRLPPTNNLAICIQSILSGEAAKDVLENESHFFPARYVPLAAEALKATTSRHGNAPIQDVPRSELPRGKGNLWQWILVIPVILLVWLGLRARKS